MSNDNPYMQDPILRHAWRLGWNAVRTSDKFEKGRLSSLYRRYSIGTIDNYIVGQALYHSTVKAKVDTAIIALYLAWPALKTMDSARITAELGEDVAALAAEVKSIAWRGKDSNKPLSDLGVQARNILLLFDQQSLFADQPGSFKPYTDIFLPQYAPGKKGPSSL